MYHALSMHMLIQWQYWYYSMPLLEGTNYNSCFYLVPLNKLLALFPTWLYCDSIGSGKSVVDAGFLEGEFCYNNAREIFMPHPLSVETTPIFERF